MTNIVKKEGQEIFLLAIEKIITEQTDFILHACEGNKSLFTYVQNLVSAYHESSDYFSELENSITKTQLNEIEDHLFRDIDFGNYQIIKTLKQGGMGTLFLAQRADGEFERQVVIKMIPIDLASIQSQNQFAHEKEILASLMHPNIVQLYDSGVTKSGQSYFVMEFIQGETLINYCINHKLAIDQRIGLFHEVLAAVGYAHQHLVIHGDIKPSNIMVNQDGKIKLLDFGIAKLINKNDTQIQGYSLNYLTPEHKNRKPIITTTDIHQLGQLLFELLTNISPKEIRGNDFIFPLLSEISRTLDLANIKQPELHTSTNKKSIYRIYKSDLQNIVNKALAVSSKNRYQSIQRFTDDLNLFKNHYPISAIAPTAFYRIKKYIKRNSILTSSITALLLFTIVFLIITIKNNDILAIERDKALTVKNLITDVFSVADPSFQPGKELSATEVLDNGLLRIRERFTSHSDIETDLLEQVAKTYQNLGEYQKAHDILNETFEIKSNINPNDKLIKAKTMLLLGENARLMSKNKKAEDWLQQSLLIFNQNPKKNTKHIASVKSKLGRVMVLLGRFAEAEEILTQATKLTKNIYGNQTLEYAQALNDLNSAYFRQGKYTQVQKSLIESKEIREKILLKTGDFILNTDYATNINNLGLAYYLQGNLEQGEKFFRQANDLRSKIFTKPHPDQAQSLTNLGLLLNDSGKPHEALPYLQKALSVREQTLSKGHMRIYDAENNLAMVYHENQEFSQAEKIFKSILKEVIKARSENHPQSLAIMTNLGNTLLELKQYQYAHDLFEQSLMLRKKSLPAGHLYLSYSYVGLGRAKIELGDLMLGNKHITKAIKIRENNLPKDSWQLGEALFAKARLQAIQGQLDINAAEEACMILKNSKGINNHLTISCFLLLKNR